MPDVLLETQFNNPLLKTADVVVFRDGFDRADAILTGQVTPVGGKTWMTRSDGSAAVMSAVIRGGRAGILTDTASAYLFGVVDAGVADGVFEIDFVSGDGNTTNLLPFRVSTVNNHLQLTVTNGLWTLRKRVSGTISTIAVSPIQKAPGQRIKIALNGPSIKVHVNGALALDVVEADHQANTLFGFSGLALATGTPATLWDNISFTIPGT